MPHQRPLEPGTKGYLLWGVLPGGLPWLPPPLSQPIPLLGLGRKNQSPQHPQECPPMGPCSGPWECLWSTWGHPGLFQATCENPPSFIWPGRVGEVLNVHPEVDLQSICKSSLGRFCYYYYFFLKQFIPLCRACLPGQECGDVRMFLTPTFHSTC